MAGSLCLCDRGDSRGSVEFKATFLLNMKHQVSSVQILHHKEQMLLLTSFTLSIEDTITTNGVEKKKSETLLRWKVITLVWKVE